MMVCSWPANYFQVAWNKKKRNSSLSLFKMNHASPAMLLSAALRAAAPGFHFGECESEQITFGNPKP